MRARFLEALTQPLADLEVGRQELERFHEPVVLVRALEANADRVERALEVLSVGLAVAEVFFDDADDERGAS